MNTSEDLFIASSAYLNLGLATLNKEFPEDHFTTITTEEFSAHLLDFIRRFRRYRRAVFYTYDLEMSRTILWHGIVWWLARQGILLDGGGRKRFASLIALLVRDAPQLVLEPLLLPYVFSRVVHDLDFLQSKTGARYPEQLSIAYLRTDHWFGTKAGGSVTHIAGVANSFRDLGIPLFFISSDQLELVDPSRTPVNWVRPSRYIQNIADAPQLAYNLKVISSGNRVFSERRPTLVYQRYSQYNYAGAYLAAKWQVPFVLEYNGSEVWIARHWGSPLRFQRWAEDIEMASLKTADAIVVVSQPMKEELTGRGIEARKILVNPNGVDLARFDPSVVAGQSAALRSKLGLVEKTVVGFIGTFGKWHGADVLARAVRPVTERNPNIHFLFIGDGVSMPVVRETIQRTGISNHVSFTGIVPQQDGPVWLGVCDILASPHVPNSDGSRFFGSPTKLFEYMAMARGIVASRLEQIGEVLRHNETALLVTPGSVEELAEAILILAGNPDRSRRLGEAARLEVSEKYTWLAHTRRILEHVQATLSCQP